MVTGAVFQRFLALACLFFQRLLTLKLPNSPCRAQTRQLSRLNRREKLWAAHDVGPVNSAVADPERHTISMPDTADIYLKN